MEDYSDIRPYLPEELPQIYEELLADEKFRNMIAIVYKDLPFEAVAATLRSCKTNTEMQVKLVYPVLTQLLATQSQGLTSDFSSIANDGTCYTFVSNHRDIVLDSAFLDYSLLRNNMDTAEIAIGDNLLIYPWIKKLVRVAKSFIVQRALTMRQMLLASAKMSRYMHYVINDKKQNIWIAQREGRAKDSDDRTQDSVLKMMAMGGEGDVINRLKDLNIVPMSISYEYDPCDYLKAKEFQQKRDIEGWKKSPEDDLLNMKTGIFGYKGHIHYQSAPCINEWLDTIDPQTPKSELFRMVAEKIDQGIHLNYRLYPANYIAADILQGTEQRSAHYTEEEKTAFVAYVEKKVGMVDLENADHDYLRERILTMYANPTLNQEHAS
jgi:hypothetical protein